MKRVAVTFFSVCVFLAFAIAQSWQRVQLIPSTENSAVREAKFWSDTGIVITGNGKILYSTDFFQNFNVDSTYKPNGFDAMSFANRETGYIISCTVPGGMLKTTDGGKTWAPLPLGQVCLGQALVFTSPDTGYSSWHDFANQLIFTFNGGQNWYGSSLPYQPTKIFKIEAVQDSLVYILLVTNFSGTFGILNIFRTSDYGAHWQNTFNSIWSVTQYSDFHFIDDTTLVLAVDGAILKSKDAGFSFDTVMKGQLWYDMIGYNVRAISFVGHDTGFVAFSNSVYKTYDAGDTWIKADFAFDSIDKEYGNQITFIKAISSQKVILGCDKGNIYKTENGGGVWSGVEEVKEQELFSISPNPATTHITITLPHLTQPAALTITNISGSIIQTEQLSATNTTIPLNQLPPGLYFATIQTNQQRITQKFIKLTGY